MDEIFTEFPYYGYRKLYKQLRREGFSAGRDKVLQYMHVLGLEPLYPKKKKSLSLSNKEHVVYRYLLKGLNIIAPNHVWAIDITYIRMIGGFVYLVAIIDWFSKYIVSYKLSNSLEVYFCQESLIEALEKYDSPKIFNSDQGSQFTSVKFTNILQENNIKISMDSKGRALDNIAIERFFRSLKYENVYINEYKTVKEVKLGIAEYIYRYNYKRLHQSLEYNTPYEIYFNLKQLTN
jgi:putative transposase